MTMKSKLPALKDTRYGTRHQLNSGTYSCRSAPITRRIHRRGQAGEGYSPIVVDNSDALAISAGVRDHVGIDRAPIEPQYPQHIRQVAQIIAQFHDTHYIELTQDLGNVVNGRLGAALLAELADVPGRQIERFIDLRGLNSPQQRLKFNTLKYLYY
jgi:hypothetical protein